jgi:hypothetical protein
MAHFLTSSSYTAFTYLFLSLVSRHKAQHRVIDQLLVSVHDLDVCGAQEAELTSLRQLLGCSFLLLEEGFVCFLLLRYFFLDVADEFFLRCLLDICVFDQLRELSVFTRYDLAVRDGIALKQMFKLCLK